MCEKFSWEKYNKLLDQEKLLELSKMEADEYSSQFVPNLIYKYMSLPNGQKMKRIRQLVEGKLWLSKKCLLNDPYELNMINSFGLLPNAKKYYDEVVKTRDIICFTKSPYNKLMWAHYANSFRGFCVEFKVKNKLPIHSVEYINNKIEMSDIYNKFYNDKEKIISFRYADDDENKISSEKKNAYKTIQIFFYKDSTWEYEEELRYVCGESDSSNEKGGLYSLKDLEIEINRIICGVNCSEIDKKTFETLGQHIK